MICCVGIFGPCRCFWLSHPWKDARLEIRRLLSLNTEAARKEAIKLTWAGKVLNWTTFTWTVGIVLFCLLVPRVFCGYICPLGTRIDLFDALVGRHLRRFHRPHVGSTSPW